MTEIIALDPDCHIGADAPRVLDLFQRARDYVLLESGKDPDLAYLRETFDGPPDLDPGDRFVLALEANDSRLMGILAFIRNFYTAQDWYIGLLLLDPSVRGQGWGEKMVADAKAKATAEAARCMRIAVLDANPRARTFWERLGFGLERTVPGDADGDGHKRHVLKLTM